VTARPRQLALALEHAARLGAEDFLVAPTNAEAHALVTGWPRWPAPALLLVGPAGAGKSHLAAIWAARSGAGVVAAEALDAEALQPLHQNAALAVEDVDRPDVSERALFHLLNGAGEAGAVLLLTARAPPGAAWPALPDLASRLRRLPQARLAAPEDALIRAVLVKLFADRQLIVEPGVIEYIFTRMERSLSTARRLVALLDQEALARGRGVSRKVAADVLAELGEADG
jgi:chromosomal replication initiation ATPase DnaA